LVSIAIGSGFSSDDFSAIDWSAGPYFVKTAIDPIGGSRYTITGTSQIMSVPFAMYAKTSGSSERNATNSSSNSTDIATNTTVLAANTLKAGYTDDLVSVNTAIASNTAKEGITLEQAADIEDNNDKVVITENHSDPCATSKVGFPSGKKSYLTNEEEDEKNAWSLNFENGQFVATTKTMSFKMRYCGSFSANSAASAILTIGTEQTTQNSAMALNTAKVGITQPQIDQIEANSGSTGSIVLTCNVNAFYAELGGFVFEISTNGEHGLLVARQDQGATSWYNANELVNNPANHDSDCAKFRDWRLPTKREFLIVYHNYKNEDNGGRLFESYYWLSTSKTLDNVRAWILNFYNGNGSDEGASDFYDVLGVGAF